MDEQQTQKPSLHEIASYVSMLVAAGVITPDPKLEKHMRQLAKLPER